MQIIASSAMRGARMGRVVAFTGDSGKNVNVKFAVKQKIHYGSHIAVVGSKPVLGEWNPTAGLELRWNEGDVWTAEAKIDFKDDEVDFKFVIVEPEDEVKWQPGDNVVLSVPEDASEVLVEAQGIEKEIVIKPIKKQTEAKVETKVEKKIPEIKKETIEKETVASISAPDVARSNIMSKPSSPVAAAAATAPAAAATSISSSVPSIAEIEKMTLPKIKAIMVKMGLETTGKKSDLIARIRSYMQT